MAINHSTFSYLDRSNLFKPCIDNKPFTCLFSFLNFVDVEVVRGVNKDWSMESRRWEQLYLEKPLKALSARTGIDGSAFITPNETGMESTFKCLAKMPKIKGGVHIGVSTLHK